MQPHTLHITLYDAAFFGLLSIICAFAFLLWFTRKGNRTANRFLTAVLAVAVLWIARLLTTDICLAGYLPIQFSLALGPLIYFYVLNTIRPGYQFRWKDLLHFSPLLLELCAQVLPLAESLKTVTLLLNVLAFVSVLGYLYLCQHIIDNFYTQKSFNNGDRNRHGLRWLHNLITAFGLLWLLWIPLVAADYFWHDNQLGVQAYCPLYLLLMSMLIWMAARTFIVPERDAAAEAVPY